MGYGPRVVNGYLDKEEAVKRGVKKKPTNGRRKKRSPKEAAPRIKPRTSREKAVFEWTTADDYERALREDILGRFDARLKAADADAARRVNELKMELRGEMRTAIGAALASRDARPPTMAYRLARTLIDILEEAEAGD